MGGPSGSVSGAGSDPQTRTRGRCRRGPRGAPRAPRRDPPNASAPARGAAAHHRRACRVDPSRTPRARGWIGPARDADVFVSYLREATSDLDETPDAVAQPLARAEHDRREAYGAARTALDSEAFARLLQELEAFALSVVLRDASMNGLVYTEGRKLRKAMEDVRRRGAARRANQGEARSLRGRGRRLEGRGRAREATAGRRRRAPGRRRRGGTAACSGSEPATALLVGRLIERQRARRHSARAEVPKAWRKLAKTIR